MTPEQPPAPTRWAVQLERAGVLDGPAHLLEGPVRRLFASGSRGELLRGDRLGHPLHPTLTDLAIGTWTSAALLDVIGGSGARTAAQRLVGVGVLAAVPTAWSGWADWSGLSPAEKRVGIVHAVISGAAIATYGASYRARRHGRHARGVALGLVGTAVVAAGSFLGGHLNEQRSTRGGSDPLADV